MLVLFGVLLNPVENVFALCTPLMSVEPAVGVVFDGNILVNDVSPVFELF